MSSTYTYSYSSDFGSSLNQTQLTKEITDDPGISPNILRIDFTEDVVDIVFDASLSVGEQTTLDNLVSSHSAITSGNISSRSTTTSSTTSTVYQTRDTLTTEYLPSGNYKIDWFYTFTCEDGTPDIRVIIDDTTVIHSNNTRVPVISSTLQYDKNGFDIQNLTEGRHIVKLQFKGRSSSTLSIIKSCLFIAAI